MKKVILLSVLLQTTLLLAAGDKPNPADFPVKVHVVFSRYVMTAGQYQQIEALIDGVRVELTGESFGVLALGDYSARAATKLITRVPKNPNTYDLYKGYEFLMPDGKTRTYQVTAMGQAQFPAPPTPSAPVDNSPSPTPMDSTPPPAPPPPMPTTTP